NTCAPMIGAHPKLVNVAAARPRPPGEASHEMAIVITKRPRHQPAIVHAGRLRVVLVEPFAKLVGQAVPGVEDLNDPLIHRMKPMPSGSRLVPAGRLPVFPVGPFAKLVGQAVPGVEDLNDPLIHRMKPMPSGSAHVTVVARSWSFPPRVSHARDDHEAGKARTADL